MKEGICLFWDLLHTVGLLLVIVHPFETCISGLILGLLWKREIISQDSKSIQIKIIVSDPENQKKIYELSSFKVVN